MSDFKVIESQEEFDARVKERIARAEKKGREEAEKEFKDSLKSLKSENSSLKNEVAGYKESLDSVKDKDEEIKGLNEKISAFERADAKRKIALEYDIPYKLADRIKGDDEEAMKEDAKFLSEYYQKSSNSYEPPLKNYENDISEEDQAYKELLDGLEN